MIIFILLVSIVAFKRENAGETDKKVVCFQFDDSSGLPG